MSIRTTLEIVGVIVGIIVGVVTVSCQVEKKIEQEVGDRVDSLQADFEKRMTGLEAEIGDLREQGGQPAHDPATAYKATATTHLLVLVTGGRQGAPIDRIAGVLRTPRKQVRLDEGDIGTR